MVGYGDKLRTYEETCELFNQEYPDRPPIATFTVGKLVAKFTETGSVHDLPRQGRPRVKEETRLDLLYLKLKKILTILQGN
jgi:hypothetical protein